MALNQDSAEIPDRLRQAPAIISSSGWAKLIHGTAAILLALAACSGCGQNQTRSMGGDVSPMPVGVEPIVFVEETVREFNTYGQVEPPRQLSFQTPLSLPVTMIRPAGDQVKKGEVLVRLNTGGLQQQRTILQNAISQASPAERERLNSQLLEVSRQIDMATIVAPFDLLIQNSIGNDGAVIEAGRVLMQVVERGPRRISVGLPKWVQQELFNESLWWVDLDGEMAQCTIESDPGSFEKYYTEKKYLVPLEIDGETVNRDFFQAVSVRFEFPLVIRGCWVPMTALITDHSGNWSLFKVSKPKVASGSVQIVKKIRVQVYCLEKNRAYVNGNLDPTDFVIGRGTQRVAEGQEVWIEALGETGLPENQLSGQR